MEPQCAGIIVDVWSEGRHGKERVSRKVVRCPSGRIPEDVAEENGGSLVDFYSRVSDAMEAVRNELNGKADAQ